MIPIISTLGRKEKRGIEERILRRYRESMRIKIRENPSKSEITQEVVYNLVEYLPLAEMGITDGTEIREIVNRARAYKNMNGKVEDGALETLEACLKEESGISDIGNAKIYYTSFNKNTNDLIAHGVTRKEADTITDAKAISAAVFIYKSKYSF